MISARWWLRKILPVNISSGFFLSSRIRASLFHTYAFFPVLEQLCLLSDLSRSSTFHPFHEISLWGFLLFYLFSQLSFPSIVCWLYSSCSSIWSINTCLTWKRFLILTQVNKFCYLDANKKAFFSNQNYPLCHICLWDLLTVIVSLWGACALSYSLLSAAELRDGIYILCPRSHFSNNTDWS